jgi:SAM-dependent methyltransferase
MTPENLPYSPAAERNRVPLLEVLMQWLADRRAVLEIGSGTGQHAVHFAAALPHLRWQCTDLAALLPALRAQLDVASLPNTPPPIELDAGDAAAKLAGLEFDAVFTANTLHIMAWQEVERLFEALEQSMPSGGLLIVYGPFNYEGRFTSAGNAAFDASLRSMNPQRGLRDFEAVDALAKAASLRLLSDLAMPANNRCLVWLKD